MDFWDFLEKTVEVLIIASETYNNFAKPWQD